MDSLSCEVSKSKLAVFLEAQLQFRQQQWISYWEHLAKFFGPVLWRRSGYTIIIVLPGLKCYQSMKHGLNFKSHSKSFCIHLTSVEPFNMVEVKHALKCSAEWRGTCPLVTDRMPKCFVEMVPQVFVSHQRCK